MPKILLVGQDSRLLETRAAVLARIQANVVCSDVDDALEILEREMFELVVLCHSLPEKQASEITETIRRRWPKTKILLVVSGMAQERFYQGVEFDATSSSDPNRLIQRSIELLRLFPHPRIEDRVRVERHQAAS